MGNVEKQQDIGDRIRILRKRAKMTQSTLAGELGISPSTIGMYEQNARRPEYDTLVKMSQLFAVSTDYLITGEMAESKGEAGLRDLLEDEILVAFEDYESWSEEDKNELLAYLRVKQMSRMK